MTVHACPFCQSHECAVFECDVDRWAVFCADCGAIGPQAKSADSAVTAWNCAPQPGAPGSGLRPDGNESRLRG